MHVSIIQHMTATCELANWPYYYGHAWPDLVWTTKMVIACLKCILYALLLQPPPLRPRLCAAAGLDWTAACPELGKLLVLVRLQLR